MIRTLALSLVLGAAPMAADAADTWRLYDAKLAAACPSHHVDLLCGDCQRELIETYEAMLPTPLARRVGATADVQHACAAETIGFGCEVGRSLVAYRRFGLLDRFVRYGCRTVRCEEAALCSRYPGLPH